MGWDTPKVSHFNLFNSLLIKKKTHEKKHEKKGKMNVG